MSKENGSDIHIKLTKTWLNNITQDIFKSLFFVLSMLYLKLFHIVSEMCQSI